jgi:hypothetical protein
MVIKKRDPRLRGDDKMPGMTNAGDDKMPGMTNALAMTAG